MQDNNAVFNTFLAQLPMILMYMNNGTLSPIVIIMLLIPFIKLIIDNWDKLTNRWHIPKDYVTLNIDDDRCLFLEMDNIFSFYNYIFAKDIKNINLLSYNNIYPDKKCFTDYKKCLYNIYDGKIKLVITDKIMENISNVNLVFPSDMNFEIIRNEIFYLDVTKYEEIVKNSYGETKVKKSNIKISGKTIKHIDVIIYIISNYKKCISLTQKYKPVKQTFTNQNQIKELRLHFTKSYDNVFLSDNNNRLVINALTKWIDNGQIMTSKGIPNKLGLCFTGKPGCGKSSLIYAIANHLEKPVNFIKMNKMTNNTFYDRISYQDNSIVVFEDIDSYPFVRDRKIILENDDKKSKKKCENEDEITLDNFLEVLDGYGYLNKSIIILTTNHPEMIDPAVLRPGRIDHIIEFKYCDKYQFEKIFEYYVEKPYTYYRPDYEFVEYSISTSHLINTIILPNIDNPDKIFDLIDESVNQSTNSD